MKPCRPGSSAPQPWSDLTRRCLRGPSTVCPNMLVSAGTACDRAMNAGQGRELAEASRNHRSRGKSPCAPEEQAIELLAQEDDTLKEKELCFSIVTDLKRATSTA